MEARPPALIHKPTVEPLSPYTWGLVIANFILILINLISIFVVVPVYDNLYQHFGGQLPWKTQTIVNISKIFISFWFVIFPSMFIILLGTWSLVKFRFPKYLARKTLLAILAYVMASFLIWCHFSLLLPIFKSPAYPHPPPWHPVFASRAACYITLFFSEYWFIAFPFMIGIGWYVRKKRNLIFSENWLHGN